MCEVTFGGCDPPGRISQPTDITWKNAPISNLKNPPLNDFTYLLTYPSVKMKKNGVPLKYDRKYANGQITYVGDRSIPHNALAIPQFSEDDCRNSLGQGEPWPDARYPYNIPLKNISVNSGFVESQCTGSDHLYFFLNGSSRYCHNSTNVADLGEWCGKINPADSCTLGIHGKGTCGRYSDSSSQKNTDWGFIEEDPNFVNMKNSTSDRMMSLCSKYGRYGYEPMNGSNRYSACFPDMLVAAKRDVEWNNQDLTVFPTQWIYCNYSYDYSGYSYNNTGSINGPEKLNKWFLDIYTNIKSNSNKDGERFLNSTFIYTCIVDFYNQLYNQDYYSTPNQQLQKVTNFLNAVGGGEKAVTRCIDNSKSSIVANFQPLYSDAKMPPSLILNLKEILKFPTPIKDNNSYCLKFNLPWKMYKSWKDSNSKDNYLSDLINNMLGNENLKMRNVKQKQDIPKINVVLSDSTEISFQCIQVAPGSNGENSYNISTDTDMRNLFTGRISGDINTGYIQIQGYVGESSKYKLHLLTSVQIKATITQWSPLLILYFYNFNDQIVFSENDCNLIYSQTNVMPTGCLNIDNIYTNAQKMKNICSISVNGDGYINSDSINHTISGQNSEGCICASSALTPAGIFPKVLNNTAMCFSNNCQLNDLKRQGLTDGECSKYCDEIYGWMFNNDPNAPQPANPSEFDRKRFEKLCPGYLPNISNTFNTSVVLSTIFLILVVGFFSWSFCSLKKGYSAIKTGIITTLAICVVTGLGVFCSIDLAGSGMCEGKLPNMNWVCKSKLTKIPIPNEFCHYVQNCECLWDNDCGSGCVCSSSFCNPISGERSKSPVTKPDVQICYIFVIIIALFLVPLGISYMGKNNYTPLSISIVVIFLVLIYVLNMTKTVQQLGPIVCNN